MNWASAALLSSGILGIVNIVDSHLLTRRMPSLASFLLPAGMFHLIYGTALFFIFPFPEGAGTYPLAIAIASGVVRAISITIMLYTMTREEISQVVPVVYTYPVFVAIAAVMLLDERLVYLQWLAIAVVAAGVVLISLKRGPSGRRARLFRSFGLLLLSSLLLAAADVTAKYALDYFSSWNMYSLSVVAMSATFIATSLRGNTLRELRSMPRLGSALTIIACNELLTPAGIVLSFWAIEHGQVSLVSTILASRPIFVFLYALILSRIWPAFLNQQLTRGALLVRFVATAMIVSGVAVIYLA